MVKFNFPGAIHFLTFNTFQRYPYFKDEKCCELFLENLDGWRDKFKFRIYGYSILPEHVHLLLQPWVAPNSFGSESCTPNEFGATRQGISYIVKMIKGVSAREINLYLKLSGNLWQPGFYDYNIYSFNKFNQKLEYIHKNPFKHGLTNDIAGYKYCSWRNYEMGDHSIFKINYLEY